MTSIDDGILLDRWRESRDGDAFAEIARRHSPVVYDLTCRVLGDRAGAEDVLQEALLSLALEPTRKPVEVGVVAWLARFAICRARNRRSSERSRARRQIVVGSRRPEESMPDDALARTDELEHALAGCNPEDRALLAMRFLHGWDYDRIASALTISEGAARVRVHRALEAVRKNAKERDGAQVTRALAAAPVAALTSSRLEATIRSTVEVAKVRLGAPPNGVEHATAMKSAFRAAVGVTGAALLLVVAAGAATVATSPGSSDASSAAEIALAAAGVSVRTAIGADGVAHDSAAAGSVVRFPRPADWDRGALGPPAASWVDDVSAVRRTARAAVPAAAEPAPRPADPCVAAADGDPVAPIDALPNASRPTSRGACAAKGDSVSSDGERAGAFGGASTIDVSLAAEVPASLTTTTTAPTAAPSRAASGGRAVAAKPESVAFDALPEDTRALVGEAEGLVRDVIGTSDLDGRAGVREIRRQFAKMRRDAGTAAEPRTRAARAKRSAAIRQVLSLLSAVVLTDGGSAGDVRWPSGADANAALAEVIRVLAAGAGSGRGLPSGAVPLEQP